MVIETLHDAPPPLPTYDEVEIWSVIRGRTRVLWGAGVRIEFPYPSNTLALLHMVRRCAAIHFGCADDDRLLWVKHEPVPRTKAGKVEPHQRVTWFARYPDYEHENAFAQYNLNDLR